MRKEQKRKIVKSRTIKSPFKILFSLAMLALSGYLVYVASQEAFITLNLRSEISSNHAKIKDLKTKQSTLADQKEKLKDPNYIVRYARDKFLASKPGEQVFKLPGGSANNNSK